MTPAAMLALLAAHGQCAPLTDTDPAFDLAAAYAFQHAMTALRVARGERVVGRKIGFTNTQIWETFKVHAPIWGPVFATTLRQGPLPVADFTEPLIEPEIVLRLCASPAPGMEPAALMDCVDAVATGFEIVQSPYAGWRFKAPDTVAAGAMHGALVIGDWVEIGAERALWRDRLGNFTMRLSQGGQLQDEGPARNVLDQGPLAALAHLVDLLGAARLAAGEVIATGTITRALPIAAGQQWHAQTDLPVPGLSLSLI